MDRSSLTRIESTKDLEKRQSFKTKLADRLEAPQSKELPPLDNTFNGVSPGGILIHPSLGEGTLVEVDHKNNEVLIDFASKGLIGLVLTQAKTFVHAPIKKQIKNADDPFLGEEIQRLLPDRSDTAYRPVNLSESKVISPDFKDSNIPTFEVGTKVYNKELGECTIVSLDQKANEIILDSDRHGCVNLIFTQVRTALTPISLIYPEPENIDDAFFGSEILRDGPVRPDAVQREFNTSKVISPDFIEPERTFIQVGSTVWHPDLGTCLVLSVDEKTNQISLSSKTTGIVDIVLSQVRSKLRTVETAVEHIPIQPLVREKLSPQIPQYKSRGEVSVNLPMVFKTWQKNQQFMFLTRSQKLTTEQANDVFSVLDGSKPLFYNVKVDWQSQEETQASIIPGPEALSTKIDGVRVFPEILQQKNLWHPDFGECSVASVEDNQLILMTSVGQVPCVLDATIPKLAVLDTATTKVEHAPKRLGIRALAPLVKDGIQPLITLILPNEFNTWKSKEKYQYLTGNKHLIPEDANAFLAGSADKFDIQWSNELPEASKRAEFKEQLLGRVERAVIGPASQVIPVPIDHGIKRTIEKVVVKKEAVIKKVPVDLPLDFKEWTPSGQYVFLTRTKQLTFNEANDVMDVLNGKKPLSNIEYNITWGGSPITQIPNRQRDIEEVAGKITVKNENVLKKISVDLPPIFKNWASSGQFGFLTRSRQLTFDEANDVLAILKGDRPQNNKVRYEIVWSE